MKKSEFNPRGKFLFLVFVLFFSLVAISSANADVSENSTSVYSDPIPTFSFPNIQPGSTINGTTAFKVKIPLIQGLTIYLTPEGSDTPKATAIAKKLDGDYWSITFNSKSVPDGTYYLSAKIKSAIGEIEAAKIKVQVDNSTGGQNAIVDQQSVDTWISKLNSADSNKIQQNVDAFLDSMLTPEWLNEYFHKTTCDDQTVCGALADPDNDGLINVEEFRLGTDPTNPDTAGNGHTDGWEVQNGYDPLTGNKINYQSPKDSQALTSDIYKVLDVVDAKTDDNKTAIALKGHGLPKSFVTLFIYSEMPIVLTVETDDNGNWSYMLDNNIDNGVHQAYVAVTDNTGKITAKSQPLFFVKTAEAVNVIPPTEASGTAVSSPASTRQTPYMLASLSAKGCLAPT
jgi:hypothetical protein